MDLTRLQQRLQPKPDGESAVRHRTGIVDAVNSDGTVDLDLGGVVVPDVSVLDGAVVGVGETVQVAVWAGDMLVLGTPRGSANGSLGILAYHEATSNQGSIGGTFVALTNLATASITVPTGRRIQVTGQVQAAVDAVADTTAQLAIIQDVTVIQSVRNRPVGNNRAATLTGTVVVTSNGAAHTYSLSLRREVGTGTLTMTADAANRALLLVEDIGVL